MEEGHGFCFEGSMRPFRKGLNNIIRHLLGLGLGLGLELGLELGGLTVLIVT